MITHLINFQGTIALMPDIIPPSFSVYGFARIKNPPVRFLSSFLSIQQKAPYLDIS